MKKEIVYYGHRLRDKDPKVQAANLKRARKRMRALQRELGRGVIVWAPWMVLAEGGASEYLADAVISTAIWASSRVVLDLDGRRWTDGLRRESELANLPGIPCEVRP